jgi:hypothetical protein
MPSHEQSSLRTASMSNEETYLVCATQEAVDQAPAANLTTASPLEDPEPADRDLTSCTAPMDHLLIPDIQGPPVSDQVGVLQPDFTLASLNDQTSTPKPTPNSATLLLERDAFVELKSITVCTSQVSSLGQLHSCFNFSGWGQRPTIRVIEYRYHSLPQL